jgi:ribosomal protein L3
MTNRIVIAELRRIAAKHRGVLEPAAVVKAARPKSSPLHSKFEWNNSAAAEGYRLWQARQLISVTVEYIGRGKEGTLQRVFVSLSTDRHRDGAGYRTMTSVVANKTHREQLLEDAVADMKRFREKYAQLKELAEVFAAMRKVRKKRVRA